MQMGDNRGWQPEISCDVNRHRVGTLLFLSENLDSESEIAERAVCCFETTFVGLPYGLVFTGNA